MIVLFTDASAHNLESRVGEIPAAFRAQVPASLDELTDRWERKLATRLVGDARRLVVFAPDTYPWSIICDEDGWNNALWLPGQAGENLEDAEYEVITTSIVNHF